MAAMLNSLTIAAFMASPSLRLLFEATLYHKECDKTQRGSITAEQPVGEYLLLNFHWLAGTL